jgi:hypothetical protein
VSLIVRKQLEEQVENKDLMPVNVAMKKLAKIFG